MTPIDDGGISQSRNIDNNWTTTFASKSLTYEPPTVCRSCQFETVSQKGIFPIEQRLTWLSFVEQSYQTREGKSGMIVETWSKKQQLITITFHSQTNQLECDLVQRHQSIYSRKTICLIISIFEDCIDTVSCRVVRTNRNVKVPTTKCTWWRSMTTGVPMRAIRLNKVRPKPLQGNIEKIARQSRFCLCVTIPEWAVCARSCAPKQACNAGGNCSSYCEYYAKKLWAERWWMNDLQRIANQSEATHIESRHRQQRLRLRHLRTLSHHSSHLFVFQNMNLLFVPHPKIQTETSNKKKNQNYIIIIEYFPKKLSYLIIENTEDTCGTRNTNNSNTRQQCNSMSCNAIVFNAKTVACYVFCTHYELNS